MSNPILNARGDDLLYGGEIDPRVEAVDAPKGAVYIYAPEDGSDGEILQKQDNGETTAWDIYTTGMATDFSNADPSAKDLDLGAFKITNMADPTDPQDAATQQYVLDQIALSPGGDEWSDPVDANIVPDGPVSRNLGSINNPFNDSFSQKFYLTAGDSDIRSQWLDGGVTPSGQNTDSALEALSNKSNDAFGFYSTNDTAANSSPTASLFIETGYKTAGSGNTGSINLRTGDSSGNQSGGINLILGNSPGPSLGFKFLDTQASAPSPGDVWTCTAADGSGYWASGGGGDAWGDPVDANIIPDAGNNRDLGSVAKPFRFSNFRQIQLLDGSSIRITMDGVGGGSTPFGTTNDARIVADNITDPFVIGAGNGQNLILEVDAASVAQVQVNGANGMRIPVIAGDAFNPGNGSIWYNTSTNQLRAYVNGAFVTIA